MTKARLAARAGIALIAFLFGVPFARNETAAGGTGLDLADFICAGARTAPIPSAPQGGSGASVTVGAHEHAAPAGLYMPMFSTPPKGGAIYNGPPLDQC